MLNYYELQMNHILNDLKWLRNMLLDKCCVIVPYNNIL